MDAMLRNRPPQSASEGLSLPGALTPIANPSDEHLLQDFAAGNRHALDELFRRYQLPAYRVAYYVLSNQADALDAVQEGFVNAWRYLHQFKGQSSFKTWLLKIVRRAALRIGRVTGIFHARNRGRGAAEVEYARAHQAKQFPTLLAELADQELPAAIERILKHGPDRHRQVYAMWRKGQRPRQIAGELGISAKTVRQELWEVLATLRNELPLLGWSVH